MKMEMEQRKESNLGGGKKGMNKVRFDIFSYYIILFLMFQRYPSEPKSLL